MDGLLIIDKPSGCTSHDVVLRIRRLLAMKRVGHGGTLDPDATGVLVITLGQATRFFPYISKSDKTYEGQIRLGFSTDTYDASGRPTSEEKTSGLPGAAEVAAAMKTFEGETSQVPPPYSAKKLGGRPAYSLARARNAFALEPVRVVVHAFQMLGFAPPVLDFRATCSAGTYVRSLAHDLGVKLGCGAHLCRLRRTSSGPYAAEDAVSLADVERAAAGSRVYELLVPLERLLPDVPAAVLSPGGEARVKNGLPLFAEHLSGDGAERPSWEGATVVRVFAASGRLVALARPASGRVALRPFLIIR
jgi:tRNA pseudouridine55 synthase